MKSMNHIALLASLFLLLGCATTFRPWSLSEIEEGMDRIRVVGILGEPDSVEMKDGAEFLYYSYSENYNPAPSNFDAQVDNARRRQRERQIERSLRTYRYVVTLFDGKVQSYKELVD